jgi:hypothetical protein
MHRVSLATQLLHPRQFRKALASKPATGTVAIALRSGLSVTLAFALSGATGHTDVAGMAAIGALASLFGRSPGHAWRLSITVMAAISFTFAIALSATLTAIQAPTVVVLIGLASMALIASQACSGLRTGPPGPMIFLFAAGAGSAPLTSTAEVIDRTLASGVGASAALLVCTPVYLYHRWQRLPVAPLLPDVRRTITEVGLWRTSAVVFVACLLAGTLADFVGWGYPAWAALGATATLQGQHIPQMGVRALQRVGGTIFGALLAVPLLHADLSFAALAACTITLQITTELVVARNYAIGMVAITAMALLMASANTVVPPAELALHRAFDTVGGAVIALITAVLLARPHDAKVAAEHAD